MGLDAFLCDLRGQETSFPRFLKVGSSPCSSSPNLTDLPLGCVLPDKNVKDIPIPPGQSFTYSWKITPEDGPTQADPRCLTRFYYSSVDPVRDTASGLIGPLLICSRYSMDQRGNQVSAPFVASTVRLKGWNKCGG